MTEPIDLPGSLLAAGESGEPRLPSSTHVGVPDYDSRAGGVMQILKMPHELLHGHACLSNNVVRRPSREFATMHGHHDRPSQASLRKGDVASGLSLDCEARLLQRADDLLRAQGRQSLRLRRLGEVEEGLRDVEAFFFGHRDRKSTRLNSSHIQKSRMPSSA